MFFVVSSKRGLDDRWSLLLNIDRQVVHILDRPRQHPESRLHRAYSKETRCVSGDYTCDPKCCLLSENSFDVGAQH